MNMWTWHPPVGPGTPFQGDLLVVDSLRVAAILAGIFAFIQTPIAAYYCATVMQKLRMWGYAILLFLVCTIEVEHFGDYANWRLFLVMLANSWAAWGLFTFIRYEGRADRKHTVPGRRVRSD